LPFIKESFNCTIDPDIEPATDFIFGVKINDNLWALNRHLYRDTPETVFKKLISLISYFCRILVRVNNAPKRGNYTC